MRAQIQSKFLFSDLFFLHRQITYFSLRQIQKLNWKKEIFTLDRKVNYSSYVYELSKTYSSEWPLYRIIYDERLNSLSLGTSNDKLQLFSLHIYFLTHCLSTVITTMARILFISTIVYRYFWYRHWIRNIDVCCNQFRFDMHQSIFYIEIYNMIERIDISHRLKYVDITMKY